MSGEEHFDHIMTSLRTGRWNVLYFVALGVADLMLPCLILAGPFLSPKIDHVCNPPSSEEGEIVQINSCDYLVAGKGNDSALAKECSDWSYNSTHFGHTLTADFNLVCDSDYLRPTFQTVYMMGNFFASPFNGILSDRLGRKYVCLWGTCLTILSVSASSVASNFKLILFLRLLAGMAYPSVSQTGYVMCMEVCEPRLRSIMGIVLAMPWSLGTIWWGLMGYLVKDWWWLQRISILPAFLLLTMFCFIDESPRWLIVKGEHKKALAVLKRASNLNNSSLPSDEDLLLKMKEIEEHSASQVEERKNLLEGKTHLSIKDKANKCFASAFILYRTKELRRRSLSIHVLFFVCSTVYYSLSLSGVNFDLNPFVYMAFSGLMEFPAYTLSGPIVARLGRIRPTATSYFICGGTIMSLGFISSDRTWLVGTSVMAGKLFITSAYQVIYLISSELFPTEVRLRALGTSTFISRIGSIIAPYITEMVGVSHPWIPYLLFGSLSLTAGVVVLLVPETLHQPLYDTVEQLEIDARNKHNKNYVVTATELQGDEEQHLHTDT